MLNGSKDGGNGTEGLQNKDNMSISVRENMLIGSSTIQSPSVLRRNQINFIS
jgi:hypothetical protein